MGNAPMTVMFTDLVGSTAMLVERGDEAGLAAQREAEQAVRREVAARGGTIVKSVGDGVLATFTSPRDAVGCAVGIQRSWEPSMPALRIGLNVGEVETVDGDVFGTAVNVAARVTALADAGEVLLTDIVRQLLGPSPELELESRGARRLKGLPGTVRVFAVRPAKTADGFPQPPLPELLTLSAGLPFVGRTEVWEELDRAWDAAASGERRLVLVSGEPGVGKSRLVTEFARRVHERGGIVLYGACAEDTGQPYQPFGDILDHLLAHLAQRDEVVEDLSALASLVPRLADPADDRDPDRDLSTSRYRLFTSVAAALAAVSKRRPLLVVLDDMHWARRPGAQLLEHVMRAQTLPSVMCVAIYRATDADVGEPWQQVLPDLIRRPGTVRISLRGFERDAVRDFVAVAAGQDVSDVLEPVVGLLAAQTDGNPFLLGELWRHLVESRVLVRDDAGWRAAVPVGGLTSPEGVRDVVAARIARLPGETAALLAIASVVGTSFAASILAACAGRDIGEAMVDLDPALRAGLVQEGGPGAYRFTHALVRDCVYETLSPAERHTRHLDVAGALERLAPDSSHLEVAHHMLAAYPVADAGAVVAAARRAAGESRRSVAYDEAARHLEAVLSLVHDVEERCRLLLDLADAQMRAGDVAGAQQRAREASGLARQLEHRELTVEAALVFEEANWRGAVQSPDAAELLWDALPLAGDHGRVRVLSGLTRALDLQGRATEAATLSAEALRLARELNDRELQCIALTARSFGSWGPSALRGALESARELLEISRQEGDVGYECWALGRLVFCLWVSGSFDEARRSLDRLTQFKENYHGLLGGRRRRGAPFAVDESLFAVTELQHHSAIALGEGRFADAEAFAVQANERGRFMTAGDASGGFGVQMFGIRRYQGRLEEVRPVIEAVARIGQEAATWRPALAVLYAELGMLGDAGRVLSELTADGLGGVNRDGLFAGSLTYLADTAVAVRDVDAAAAIYDELLGYSGLVVPMGWMLGFYGAADRYLGSLAALRGHEDAAGRHFEAALALEERAAMPVWLVQTRLAYGRFLAATDAGAGRAGTLLEQAHYDAVRLGMPRLAAEAQQALHALLPLPSRTDGEPAPAGLSGRELDVLRLLAQGLSNREIGERLHVSQHTAANHVRSILLKTGCANRTEAAGWALRNRLA